MNLNAIQKFKMADLTADQNTKKGFDLYENWFSGVFELADHDFQFRLRICHIAKTPTYQVLSKLNRLFALRSSIFNFGLDFQGSNIEINSLSITV